MLSQPRRCGVLGSPIRHSLSPVLHRAGYAAVGLDWEYDAHEVDEAGLPGFLAGLDPSWRGLSLTMPLKRTVVPLLDEVTDWAQRAGAANTVVLEAGRRTGHNTDVTGAMAAVRERTAAPVRSALVLGGGATAGSVLLGLAELGCRRMTLAVRDPARAAGTVAVVQQHPSAVEVDVVALGGRPPAADVVVSTIPAEAQTEAVLDQAAVAPVVFEVVYDPWPTPLAARALAEARVLVSGLDLLVHQACDQFTLMTGVAHAPLETMREAGRRALAARAGGGS